MSRELFYLSSVSSGDFVYFFFKTIFILFEESFIFEPWVIFVEEREVFMTDYRISFEDFLRSCFFPFSYVKMMFSIYFGWTEEFK